MSESDLNLYLGPMTENDKEDFSSRLHRAQRVAEKTPKGVFSG